jgi:hypothetical protein
MFMTLKKSIFALLFTAAVGSSVQAGNFTDSYYQPGDVLVTFRKTTSTTYDLVVDAGSIVTLTNLAPNTRYPITAFTGAQLAQLGTTNGLAWAVSGYFDQTILPVSAQDNLFLTRPRSSINTQTDPWAVLGTLSQRNQITSPNLQLEGDINSLWQGGNANLTYTTNNTSTAVLELQSAIYINGRSVTDVLAGAPGNPGNFSGDFKDGVVENITPSTFVASGTVARSDFYQLPYAGTTGFYLGYFELSTNGTLTYVSYGSTAVTPTVPVIKSIGVTNGVASVSFTTGASGTYSLRGSTSLSSGTAITNWPVIASVAGNGSVKTLTDPSAATKKFYIISAQ